ncbi:MAG: glycosyltransferase family 2 protein [Candidatus Marinimicrobia bacterium]|nr:glycosyltransferase family 2 protein [candidate division WOR-3 bacterium]MCK4445847.1 glycosyltransferase family 2 protein [Candidatus Neomarinimicrobiota bacterium]
MNPKVSICIPAYEEPELLRKLLNSIIIQSFENYEVIITDDSTSNCVRDVVKSFEKDSRIKYYKNSERKGSPENWNEAIKHASGKYIKIMHHDDWFSSQNSLQKFVGMMEENPNVNFAFCATKIIDGKGCLKSIYSPTKRELNKLARNPNCLFNGVSVGAPSVTIYRNNLGIYFDRKLKWYVDVDFYIRLLSCNKKFIFCPEPLICVSTSSSHRVTNECLNNKEVDLVEYFYLFQKIETSKVSDYKYLQLIVLKLFKYNVKSGHELIKLGIREPFSPILRLSIVINQFLLKFKGPIKNIRNWFRSI